MGCTTTQQNINAYLDAELDQEACLEFQHHVDGCSDCRQLLRSSKKSIALMKLVYPEFEPPTNLKQSIFAKLGAADKS